MEHAEVFVYEIVGDGPLRPRIESLIGECGLEGCVCLHGWKNNAQVAKMLERADALLAPSVTANDGDQEGIPVVLMEAMAMGVPVISTFHSGIPELIDNGVSGLLAPKRDEASLAEHVAWLASNPARKVEIARAARRRVEKEFDIAGLNQRLTALLERVASQR